MSAHASLNGAPIRSLTLRVGSAGPWVADVQLAEAQSATGAATLAIGATELRGTVIAQHASVFGLGFGARIVGGGGGWTATLSARSYHNDAGIKARLIAEDAAREAGETLGTFDAPHLVVGKDYVRAEVAASAVLEYLADGAVWFVGFDGVTHVVRERASAPLADGFDLLHFDPANNIATFALDELRTFGVGSVISDARLGAPFTVRDFELSTREGSPLRVTAWGGGSATAEARLPGLMRRIVERLAQTRLYGLYRYRVVSVANDKRVDIQAVRAEAGLPDARAVPQWPGAPGCSAKLAPGSEVLVQFIDGDPSEPVIVQYAGVAGPGFAPDSIAIHSDSVTLGGDAGPPVARQGDTVEVLLPPAQLVGTLGTAPVTGIVTWLAPTASGVITSGSGKVKATT